MKQPPYWSKCEKMNFGELRKFIDDSLKALPDPEHDFEIPRSKDEFASLVDMLDSKLDPMREAVQNRAPRPAPPPNYNYYMSPWFQPSKELESAQEELEQLQDRLDEARYERPTSRSYIDNLQQHIRDQQRVVEMRETGEREEYEKRYASYREAGDTYERILRPWRVEVKKVQRIQKSLNTRYSFIERIRRDIKRAFKSRADMTTIHLPWELAPPGGASEPVLRGIYGDLQRRGRLVGFDQERLDKLILLNPKKRYVGKAGFDGYSVFTFSYTSKALMECFIRGNAIFIFDSVNPEHWPKENKQGLRQHP